MRWTPQDFLNKPGIKSVSGGFEFHPKPAKPKANRKIKGAERVEADGVKFDSRIEQHMYGLLKSANIDFEFQREYVLQNKFRYGSEAVRSITLTVDFVVPFLQLIIDTKGHQTQQGALRWKLLKNMLASRGEYWHIEMPSTQKECDLLVNRVIYSPGDFKR